jgi:ABC-type branched-subunit amino acid transport system substrate-binding protein
MTGRIDDDQILRVSACLSLTGRFARFGVQALKALQTWQSFDGKTELIIEDDESSPRVVERVLPGLSRRCDVLLGPYSTQLVRTAGSIAAAENVIMWNHGGSGDDIQAARPGHVISILTPTSRYADPFVRHLKENYGSARLFVNSGKGAFGRQVADGATGSAGQAGIDFLRVSRNDNVNWPPISSSAWDLFTAGTFEDDVELIRDIQRSPERPRVVCAVAAGVREFANEVQEVEGIYGVGQWFPGINQSPKLGPNEADFLSVYSVRFGSDPDYPAAQAAAGAVIAAHCARQAGSTAPDAVWRVAAALTTDTFFGDFKINPSTGAQLGHRGALVRWTAGTRSDA